MLSLSGQNQQFVLHTQPFRFQIRSNSPSLVSQLSQLYPPPLLSDSDDDNIIDFVVDFKKNMLSLSQDYAFRLGSQHFRFTPASATTQCAGMGHELVYFVLSEPLFYVCMPRYWNIMAVV